MGFVCGSFVTIRLDNTEPRRARIVLTLALLVWYFLVGKSWISRNTDLALGMGAVAMAFSLHPSNPIFASPSESSPSSLRRPYFPFRYLAFRSIARVVVLFVLLQQATQNTIAIDLSMLGLLSAVAIGWMLGWQNPPTWREVWEDREILTHVSNQLTIQSRNLKLAIA